ncbi:DUF2867 domain-containing protein [Stenotrophomonas sp. SY1]|uniref:DUF2867 domain-containing protein n=1 Tax=Stenotrophomonas sp. SY1 TaxID=477235 RepID=UPI001E5B67CF|nr:DUF2867 domain-containing protein [Stenotrophomonas sp. SY1]
MSDRERAHTVAIAPGDLLHSRLAGSHFAHAARIVLPGRPQSALQAYLDIAGQVPGWFDGLMRVRNAGMRLLGMKDLGAIRSVPALAPAELAVGQRLGIFTLGEQSTDGIVLGDSDRHLRVDLSLQLGSDPAGRELTLATVVHLHRPFGRLYMLPVAPLHRMIVPRLLERYARDLAASTGGC